MNSYVLAGYLITGVAVGSYVFSLFFRRHKQRSRLR